MRDANTLDPRCQRSQIALRQALVDELLEHQDLSQVTVTSLAERAGLTRRTFYAHFKDVADLVSYCENQAETEMRAYIEAIMSIHLEELYEQIDDDQVASEVVAFLDYLRANKDFYQALLGVSADKAFEERLKNLSRDIVRKKASIGILPGALGKFFEYYLTFVISAETGVLIQWIEDGMEESSETMARIMTLLLFARPGDLYDHPIEFNIFSYGMKLMEGEE